MLLYLIQEQGNFFGPKNLFTSNDKMKHDDVIVAIRKHFDVKFIDLGDFHISIDDKIHTIYFEKVKDPLKLVNIIHNE
jgi:hypothetical protein